MTFSTRIVRPFARQRATSSDATDSTVDPTTNPSTENQGGRPGRRLALPAAIAAGALVLAGGTAAFAHAHKTVTIDVDGQAREVSTFSGSVEGLLDDEGVVVAERDAVSPTGGLSDGDVVTVRHAREVTVAQDGKERTVWTTALTADEALDLLAVRDPAVQIVASRSGGGRPELALDLSLRGPATIVVDGGEVAVDDARTTVADALESAGIELGAYDTVALDNDDSGDVRVVVQRVTIQTVTRTEEVAFSSSTKDDASRYQGTKVVATKGVAGARTIVERVTTVDGKETARVLVADTQTRNPVDEVVAVGTKKRPVTTGGGGSGKAGPIGDTRDADSLNWAALAKCESGGNPSIVSANGLYHGLYQFSVGTWRSVGGAGLPSQASPAEQTSRAKMLYLRSGAGQWPHCGPRLFS
ncbi:resuscitation-promoting factor [Cellulomonas gelida]|uniref:resuscitation-promoting factor n=1 Tax=Cellulomonas gelida TaxID=1712 RepID=UPI0011421806|nr:resuscitation-promoting factor [Cellulomonas gelida]